MFAPLLRRTGQENIGMLVRGGKYHVAAGTELSKGLEMLE
jgi:hypothetical protein